MGRLLVKVIANAMRWRSRPGYSALMLLLTSWIAGALNVPFHVDGFGTALLGALIITIVSWLLNVQLPDELET